MRRRASATAVPASPSSIRLRRATCSSSSPSCRRDTAPTPDRGSTSEVTIVRRPESGDRDDEDASDREYSLSPPQKPIGCWSGGVTRVGTVACQDDLHSLLVWIPLMRRRMPKPQHLLLRQT